jgi:ATP-binding cassette subfamily C protein CydD
LRDAPVVLLDEPTAHLDPVTTSEIMTTIAALTARRTVVLVSHDVPEQEPCVLSLNQGGVVSAAAPSGVLA